MSRGVKSMEDVTKALKPLGPISAMVLALRDGMTVLLTNAPSDADTERLGQALSKVSLIEQWIIVVPPPGLDAYPVLGITFTGLITCDEVRPLREALGLRYPYVGELGYYAPNESRIEIRVGEGAHNLNDPTEVVPALDLQVFQGVTGVQSVDLPVGGDRNLTIIAQPGFDVFPVAEAACLAAGVYADSQSWDPAWFDHLG
jgi:hypothetical protein